MAREDESTIREMQDECLLPLELLLLTPVAPRLRAPRDLLAMALGRVRAHQGLRHQE